MESNHTVEILETWPAPCLYHVLVGAVGLEPTNSKEERFTVFCNCRYAMLPNCWPGRNRTCIRWLTVIRNNPYTTGQFGIRSFKEWRIAGKTLLLRLEESNLPGAYLPNQLMRPTLHRYRNVELPIGLEPITLRRMPMCKPIYTISSYARRLPGISDVKPL